MAGRERQPPGSAGSPLRALTQAERRRLAVRLKDLTLPAGVHQRYRLIDEVRLGRSVGEAADRAGFDPGQARSWVERFNTSGFSQFEPVFPASTGFLLPPATE